MKIFINAGEAGHTQKCNLCHPKPIAHFYTHVIAPPSLWWDPNALEPLSGETLAPLENSLANRYTAFTGARRGWKCANLCLVVLGWTLGSPKTMG